MARVHSERAASFDVVVFGATAGGIMAALAAAEQGAATALVAADGHMGGMVTGGLGKTDIEGQEYLIGGRTRRFFEALGASYGTEVAWRFEPHVASDVLAGLISASGIDVICGAGIPEAATRGGRISSIQLAGGPTIEAAVFVDASYEGDLLAAAGVEHAIGREDAGRWGESLAGRRELLPGPHQFRAPVLARDEEGQLLPHVQSLDRAGRPGDGDGKVQAYAYRICLTADPETALPLPAPDGYDPRRLRLLERYLIELGPQATIRDVLGIGKVPNRKTDINSGGPVSTNLLGGAWGYLEADSATRARIADDHLCWAQAVLYFLATDDASPLAIRSEVRRYGLPADEFARTGHWPPQLYVREGRRLRGEYVLTQADVMAGRVPPDTIGLGGYNIDIREVQWLACPVSRFPDVFDEVLVEGYLSIPVRPYGIPYRCLLPRREQCTNLLVSTCIAASHVAFASYRMEPQFMIAGTAAGVAAAMSARRGGAVHDVDVTRLRHRLRREGQILEPPR